MFMHNLTKYNKGAVLATVVISLFALLGITALVADVGVLYFHRRNMQNAADAAALAAVYKLTTGNAQSIAEDYAEKHGLNKEDGAIVLATPSSTQVHVSIEKNYPLFFARVLGRVNSDVWAEAAAVRAFRIRGVMPFAPIPEDYLNSFTCGSHTITPLLDEDHYEELRGDTIVPSAEEEVLRARLKKFKDYVDAQLGNGPVNIGLITGTDDTAPGINPSNFGFLNIGPGQASAQTLSGWIKDGSPDITRDMEINYSSNQGNMNSLFTANNAAIPYMLDHKDGEFEVILPHPSVQYSTTNVPIRWGDYLIAAIRVYPITDYGCPAPGNSSAVKYRLIGEVTAVYNPLDEISAWYSSTIQIVPRLIK